MDVMTTADYKNVPSGSCIHEVRLVYKDKYYSGVWSSMWGSYRVRVPVAICKEWKDPFEELFKYLEQNPPESAEDPKVKFDKCDYLFTDMFPKMPQKESTLDKYFEEREKKGRREKWINQQI